MIGTALGRASSVEQQCDQPRRIIEETIPDSYEREQIVVELQGLLTGILWLGCSDASGPSFDHVRLLDVQEEDF